jgi:hypothetical protein
VLVRYNELLRLMVFKLTEICNQDRGEREQTLNGGTIHSLWFSFK